MTHPSPISGLAERLRAKIAAIPETDRGFHYEAADYLQRESIHAYGPIARMCMFVIDNAQALVAELAALASPLPVAAQGVGVLEALNMARELIRECKSDTGGYVTDHLDAAENWLDVIEASITKTAAPLGVEALKERMLKQVASWERDEPRKDWWQYQRDFEKAASLLAALPIPAPDAQAEAVGWLFKVRGEGNPWNFTLNKFDNAAYEFERVYRFTTPVTGEADVERLKAERDEAVAEVKRWQDNWDANVHEMSEKFRAVNIAKVIEASGKDIIGLADRVEAAEARAETAKAEAFEEAAQIVKAQRDVCIRRPVWKHAVATCDHILDAIRSRAASKGDGK